jgi:hypothetical protein
MTPPDVPVMLRQEEGVLFPSRQIRKPGTRPAPYIGLPPSRNAIVHGNAPQNEIVPWEIL